MVISNEFECFAARRDVRGGGSRLQILASAERLHLGGEFTFAAVLLPARATLCARRNVQRLPVPVRLAGSHHFPAFLPR